VLEPANTEAVVFHYVLYNRQIFFDEAELIVYELELRIDVGKLLRGGHCQIIDVATDGCKLVVVPVEATVHFIEPAVHFIEATIHLIETTVHFIETVIDRLEPAIHLVETDVDCLEPVVDPSNRSSNRCLIA